MELDKQYSQYLHSLGTALTSWVFPLKSSTENYIQWCKANWLGGEKLMRINRWNAIKKKTIRGKVSVSPPVGDFWKARHQVNWNSKKWHQGDQKKADASPRGFPLLCLLLKKGVGKAVSFLSSKIHIIFSGRETGAAKARSNQLLTLKHHLQYPLTCFLILGTAEGKSKLCWEWNRSSRHAARWTYSPLT